MTKIYSYLVLSFVLMSCAASKEVKNSELALTNEINIIYRQKNSMDLRLQLLMKMELYTNTDLDFPISKTIRNTPRKPFRISVLFPKP
jgi:hypothetical protein